MENSPDAPTLGDEVLKRTKKKYKRAQPTSDIGDSLSDVAAVSVDGAMFASAPSMQERIPYKDRRTGATPNRPTWMDWQFESSDDFLIDEIVSDTEKTLEQDNCVCFSAEEKRVMRQPWRNALIIKLLGKVLGYKALSSRIKKLWVLQGNYRIVDLGMDYFLIKFEKMEDYKHVLDGGPWVVCGHYLTVRQWTSNFSPSSDKIANLIAWIRFPELPLEYYHSMALRRIAAMVGWVVRLDDTTANVMRGSFARVCVELDLSKPLRPSLWLGKFRQRVEYEGLQLICFHCGRFGHKKEDCSMIIMQTTTNEPNEEGSSGTMAPGAVASSRSVASSFGPWMLVQRKSRKPVNDNAYKGKLKSRSNSMRDTGNRFSSFNTAKFVDGEDISVAFSVEKIGGFNIGANPVVIKEGRQRNEVGTKLHTRKGVSVNLTNSATGTVTLKSKANLDGTTDMQGPSPSFSFKAGPSKPRVFDQQHLDSSIGPNISVSPLHLTSSSSHCGSLPKLVSSNLSLDVVNHVPMLTEMDPTLLPPLNPPSDQCGGVTIDNLCTTLHDEHLVRSDDGQKSDIADVSLALMQE
uniref:CCHC-type domain-containing protein n=1 Tax=Nymphaea colorata TaxID=210225 RepID=A0A5K1DET1_9MAGN